MRSRLLARGNFDDKREESTFFGSLNIFFDLSDFIFKYFHDLVNTIKLTIYFLVVDCPTQHNCTWWPFHL